MFKILFIAFVYFPCTLFAQLDLLTSQRELIDTKVHNINISHFLLNEPSETNFNGKFKVLEFWATWCKPCLKAVPHLNKLQQKFKDSNIVFLSFTYESPQKVMPTLKKVKFETVVVTDTTRSIHRALRIEYNKTMAVPRTVLIDNENKIIWYGSPEKLKPKMIKKFLRKKPLAE